MTVVTPEAAAYGACPVKRDRRTRVEMDEIRKAILAFLQTEAPASVRQVFYKLTTIGLIDKTEAEYQRTVVRLLTEMRREDLVPFKWIADASRWQRKPRTFASLDQMLEFTLETYRRALWAEAPVYVEVWLEKEALSGVVYDVTAAWDVPLMVTKGYPSLTFLHEAAEAIAAQERPTFIYYLGDFDPSRVHIPQVVERDLRTFAPDAEIAFERIAVTPEQIAALDLPARPTKQTDSRAKRFASESVELDGIPPATLRDLVEDCITRHIEPGQLERHDAEEALARQQLESLPDMLRRRRHGRSR